MPSLRKAKTDALAVLCYAMAMPMLIPPMAIRMHMRISMIRIMIFVDFFISSNPFNTSITQEICEFYGNIC